MWPGFIVWLMILMSGKVSRQAGKMRGGNQMIVHFKRMYFKLIPMIERCHFFFSKILILFILLMSINRMSIIRAQIIQKPPETRIENVREIMHGVEIIDPYRWLEDRESPETRAWLEAQRRYTHAMLDGLPYRKAFRERFTELMRVDRSSVPIERNGAYFFMKRNTTDDQWILFFREGINGPDIQLLDPYQMSSDHSKSIQIQDVSPDGTMLVYGLREGGEDEVALWIFDVKNRCNLEDRLPKGVIYGLVFKNDNSGFYYSLFHRDKGPRLYFHKIGTDSEEDIQLFGDGIGAENGLSIGTSQNGNNLLITVEHGWTKSDVYVLDTRLQEPAKPVIVGLDGNFIPQMTNDHLFVQTDWETPNGRIVRIELDEPSVAEWKEIVPTGKDVINDFILGDGKLVVRYLHNVASSIKIFTLEGKFQGEVPMPGLCTAGSLQGANGGAKIFYYVQSFNRPSTTYYYDLNTGESRIWARDNVPFDSDLYEIHQVWYASKDGIQVPMFLVHKKGLILKGNHPTLLYGYGGFNVSITPHYNPNYALWIESGGIYAVANIRGGGEFGKEWHRGGILENKQNAIDDFITAAEWLIENRYTNPEKLAIQGESNGGLLVGAALTQRPDLYKAVICEFPDLDIIGCPRFASNPAAMYEYGNASKLEDFQYIYKYSPYQNVEQGVKYPAVLLITGDSDTRVPPLQARKMTARLQAATVSDENPIFLLYDTKAGHSGGKTLSEYINLFSYKMSFLFWQLDMSYKNFKEAEMYRK